ncbi:putative inorganic phosphate cotransporter isoform X1 [Macrobrachium rosenbergii]|uniref:putative inorganic phosphate cotransporter isoform X1 n=2 Tax=Macrobrachium rosenbergii TaxID=79674 RepID=UPI0034D78FE8
MVREEAWGCRHTLALLYFFGILLSCALRVNLSIAIVAMAGTRIDEVKYTTRLNQSGACLLPEDGYLLGDKQAIEGDFDWDAGDLGLILGAFFWGYTLTNFLGGRAAEHLGGRLVFGIGIVIPAFLSIVTPFCAYQSKWLLIANRILAGVAQGGTLPSLAVLISTWVIPKERSKFTSYVYIGSNLGTVAAMSLGGLLSSSTFMGGWPSIFYLFGILGLVWGIPWFLFIRDSHEKHPRVSAKELEYIAQEGNTMRTKKVIAIPWKDLGTSLPFWAIVFACFGNSFGFYILLNGLPQYFANILYFDIKSNGLLSAVPYLGMTLLLLFWGQLTDSFVQRKMLSVRTLRKLSTAVGCYGPMLGLVALSFVRCDAVAALVILCLSISISGVTYCGYPVSNQDIAPNLSGTLVGLANTVGAFTGILAPGITGLITQGNQTPDAWRLVFLITAGGYLISTTFYLIFATDQVQPWNECKSRQTKEIKQELHSPRPGTMDFS